MTRAEFTTEFQRGMRFVIQKHDRVRVAEHQLRDQGTNPMRERAYAVAQTNLDAAIDQVADHVFDAMEQVVFQKLASYAAGAQ
jgi:hypothetical protein